jgi:glyceraldehyde-3-phosphate dehydrogenase (NAD(P))
MMENVLWDEGFRLDNRDAYFFQAIHQESIVVPENVDAIRAALDLEADGHASIAKTDRAIGLSHG